MTFDYLKSFIIGSSGLVVFQHFALYALKQKSYYTINYPSYSMIAPFYYGFMNVLSVWIASIFNLNLSTRLFVISIISIIFIILFNYTYSRKKYKPYSEYNHTQWLQYAIQNGFRHFMAFNVVIYYLEKLFPIHYLIRVFIIGSSLISFIFTFYRVSILDKLKLLNYNYELFTTFEPIIQGTGLVIYMYIGKYILDLNIKNCLILWVLLGNCVWFILAYHLKSYKYNTEQWKAAFIRNLLSRTLKSVILFYLLQKYK